MCSRTCGKTRLGGGPPVSRTVRASKRSSGTLKSHSLSAAWMGMCRKLMILLVGAAGFEPATPCAQGRCATRLRHAPTVRASLILEHQCRFRPEHLPPAAKGLEFESADCRLVGGVMSATPLAAARRCGLSRPGCTLGGERRAILEVSKLSGDVVQLVRTPACHVGGRGFEPRRPRHCLFGGFLWRCSAGSSDRLGSLHPRPASSTRERRRKSARTSPSHRFPLRNPDRPHTAGQVSDH
jgi:hypothetical protein